MKRIISLIVVLFILQINASADKPDYQIYLPIIIQNVPVEQEYHVSNWKIIVPETTVNKVLNPSAEIAGNITALGGGTLTPMVVPLYGHYGGRLQTAADNDGIAFTLSALANAVHYVTVRANGTFGADWDWSLDNATYTEPVFLEQIDADWYLYGLAFPAAQASGSTTLYIRQNGAGALDLVGDGFQVEEKAYWTTYCDGSQEGCTWAGSPNASYSTRSAISRAGGRVRDLEDDYHFDIGGFNGAGYVPVRMSSDSYSFLPGAQLNNIKMGERVFTLTGVIRGVGSWADYHEKKQALIEVLAHDAYPKIGGYWQPVSLIYTGSDMQKTIKAYYEGGLEGNISTDEPCYWERCSIRFRSPDPFFREIGNSSASIDTTDSGTYSYIAGRLASTGQWSNLGSTFNNLVQALEIGSNGLLYAGGGFTVPQSRIASWNGTAWAGLGTGMNSSVYAMAVGPDGYLYVGGNFTSAGGTACEYVAYWDGSSWTAIGSGDLNGAVLALAFGHDGTLYAGGQFGSLNYVAYWDGTNWVDMDSGTNGNVTSIAVSPNGTIYAAGSFQTPENNIMYWDGAAWQPLGSGLGTAITGVNAITFGIDGSLYAAGYFAAENYIARWDGTDWYMLGSGLDDAALAVQTTSANNIFIGGQFTTAGGVNVADGIALWDGSSYYHLDIDFPATSHIYSLKTKSYNDNTYDLYAGFDQTGTAYTGGSSTATNNGNQPSYPIIYFKRTGGTSATISTLRNETTGAELLFNYQLLDGETLTVDLTPTKKSIVSSFFGPRFDAILANSDFGSFTLQPGANQITSFVINDGATVTAWLEWQEAYKSAD